MNDHAKFEASSFKIDSVKFSLIFGQHFIFWWTFFLPPQWLRVVKTYLHAKFRACSLKMERAMLNLFFCRHFVYCRPFY